MIDSDTFKALQAIEQSPSGIASLDVLYSLGICGKNNLRIILSRLSKDGKILRLKRGVYSANPMKDPFACAQAAFNGYLGFSSALYLHGLISEIPFTIHVVTRGVSSMKRFGGYEFRAVAMKERAVGFERKDGHMISSRAKTLFDCIALPRYSIEEDKLVEAYREARLSESEWEEFDDYAFRFPGHRFSEIKRRIKEGS